MMPSFPERHPWDRPFFAAMLLIIWAVIVSGFGYHNIKKLVAGQFGYPWVVHVHALFFVAWLIFLTAQILLVRRGQVATHRRLGMFGAALATIMVVLGVMTAIITEQVKFGTPAADAKFLSVMFSDMLVFGGLVAAGIFVRRQPAAHKRIMLVSTLLLTDAGFGRGLSPLAAEWLGLNNYWQLATFAEGVWPFVRFQLLPMYLLVAAVGAYDLYTRKRLHPAYLLAIAWSLPIHLLAGWLYFQPFWHHAALRIVGP